jgi:hypothetical protein
MMRSTGIVLAALFIALSALSCGTKKIANGEDKQLCEQDRTSIDFGVVIVGGSSIRQVIVSAADVEGDEDGVSMLVTCEDKDFAFSDELGQVTTDEHQIDLTAGASDTFHVIFAPVTAGEKTYTIVMGSDCSDIKLSGTGALEGGWVIESWQKTHDLYDIWGSSGQTFACGEAGTVVTKVGESGDWTAMSGTGTGATTLRSVWGFEGGDVWFVGGEDDLGGSFAKAYTYSIPSETWAEHPVSTMLDYYGSAWGAAPCDIYLGGASISGMMPNTARWVCSGFETFILGWEYDLVSGIFGSGPDDIWAVQTGALDSLHHFNGTRWQSTKAAFMNRGLHEVWVSPEGEAFAVGDNGAIYHFTGTEWVDQTLPASAVTLHGVFGSSGTDVYAVGSGPGIYHYDGNVWQPLAAPEQITETLYAVWARSADEVYTVGENGVILRYVPGD